jgi:serine/threonine protein kinase
VFAELRPGDVLDERFSILERLGRGGMASVFAAIDLSTGRRVALKVPFFDVESDPTFYSRFEREREIGRQLHHPAILETLPVENPSRPYIAMEYVEGETLWDRLQREHPIPIDEALRLSARVCDALTYMHERGVVHRDLKPTNIMLCCDDSLRVMDFGIAMAAAARRLTFAGLTHRVGTPDYMAPEQVKGQRGDARTDLFSLGAILYEMTTGSAPYAEQPDLYSVMNARVMGDPVAPRTRNPDVPAEVEEIILHALARRPDDRYQSADEMRVDLRNPGQVRLSGRAARLQAPAIVRRRWRRIAQIVAVGVAIPIVLFVVLLLILTH